MKTCRILISSPGDVKVERDRAQQVVEGLRKRYVGWLNLKPLFWEDMPLTAGMSFQEGIDLVLSKDNGVDIAVFILWSRLGSPLGERIRKAEGDNYKSGTERELDLMLQAWKDSGNERPQLLVYLRDDDTGFDEGMRGLNTTDKEQMVLQKKQVESFIQEKFHDPRDHTNIRAYSTFKKPQVFSQRLRVHLQALLDPFSGLEGGDPAWDIHTQGEPFRGLQTFDFEHSPVFFGREDEILEVRQALRAQAKEGCAFVLIWGASGSGKSSLARAGVLPEIVANEVDQTIDSWGRCVFTPSDLGADLFLGFAGKLNAVLKSFQVDVVDDALLAKGLRENPALTCSLSIVPGLLKQGGKSKRIIVLADQLEEIFTNDDARKEVREPFLEMLEALAHSGSVWVLATLRSDFYAAAQTSPALVRMREPKGNFDLTAPSDDAIRRMVEDPARAAGLKWEKSGDRTLAAQIVRDVRDHGELLPLLEYLLLELFKRKKEIRKPESSQRVLNEEFVDFQKEEGPRWELTFAAYDELGGVHVALERSAELIYTGLSEAAQGQFAHVMRRVTTVAQEEGGSFVRRWGEVDELVGPEGAQEFVSKFIEARLFISKRAEDGSTGRVVSVAHEALLSAWKLLAGWLAENRRSLKTRTAISGDARIWREMKAQPSYKFPSYLYTAGQQLDEAKGLLDDGFLDFAEREFVEASLAAAAETRFRACLKSGEGALECSGELEQFHPKVRLAVLGDVLNHGGTAERRNAAMLLGSIKSHEFVEDLTQLAVSDPENAVRTAAAWSLMRLDSPAPCEEIVRRMGRQGEGRGPLGALARLLVAADMQTVAPNFDQWFAGQDPLLRRRVRFHSWLLRTRAALPVFLAVVIPAMILAVFSAMAFKWIPGTLNYAYGQATPSAIMSIFHAATAAVFIGGASAFGLTFFRMVLGREHGVFSYFRPLGAVAAGALFGGLGGLLCTLAIAGVFLPEGLWIMGWIDQAREKPAFGEFARLLFFGNRCGLTYVLNGAGVGIGMALMTNRLRGSPRWESFLDAQTSSSISEFSQAGRVVKGLVRLAFPFAWPLPAVLVLTSLTGLFLLHCKSTGKSWHPSSLGEIFLGGMAKAEKAASKKNAVEKLKALLSQKEDEAQGKALEDILSEMSMEERRRLRDWKTSIYGHALGVAGDSSAKIIGGFFAVVGMGFGIVILRCGINVEPRKRTG